MATVYGPWVTRLGFKVRVYLTYTEYNRNTTYLVRYSCGIQASGGDKEAREFGVKVSATGASDTAWHTATIKKSSTVKSYKLYGNDLVWDKSKSSQTKTIKVYLSEYTDTSYVAKTITIPTLQHWSITYNANSGSGAPAAQTKWYNEQLILSSVKPTKSGYTFRGWATSQANASNGSPSDAYGPGAIIAKDTNGPFPQLWAVWELNYSKPIISNFDVKRCKSDGEIHDEGTYAIATFDWSVFKSSLARYYGGSDTPYNNNSADTFTVTIGDKIYTDSLSGTSSPATTGIMGTDVEGGAFEMSKSYPATVSLTDTQTTQAAHTGTASDTLPSTHFPLDFNADATAMGIFCPASDDIPGVHVGSMLYGNVPFAQWKGHTKSNSYTTVGDETFKGFNVFSGTEYSYSHLINDTNTFATDNNGVKILRDGYYLLTCEAHYNTQNTDQAVATRIFNYTTNSKIGPDSYTWQHPSWAHTTNFAIAEIHENEIVLPTFEHYQGSGWARPTSAEFTVIYLGDLVI